MKVFIVEIHTVHDFPDYQQLMLEFYGGPAYRIIHEVSRGLTNKEHFLYADVGRTVFTSDKLDEFRRLLDAYYFRRRVGLLGYDVLELELPDAAVALLTAP